MLRAGRNPSTFGFKGKETLPTKREKYEVQSRFHRRNVLLACKIICKQENLWCLGIELLYRGVIYSVPFQLELGVRKGKNRSRGNMQIAARLTSLFSSLPRYTAGKFSSSVRRNPWISELLLRHPFKSGSALLLRLHFKEVAVNRLRRQPGTKQSLIFRHNSAVSSPPPKPLSPPSPSRAVPRSARLPRAPLRDRERDTAALPARAHPHPPKLPQVPRFWCHDSAGAAVTAPTPPVCSPAGGPAARSRSGPAAGEARADGCLCAAPDGRSAAQR